jgi:hypothetical protein
MRTDQRLDSHGKRLLSVILRPTAYPVDGLRNPEKAMHQVFAVGETNSEGKVDVTDPACPVACCSSPVLVDGHATTLPSETSEGKSCFLTESGLLQHGGGPSSTAMLSAISSHDRRATTEAQLVDCILQVSAYTSPPYSDPPRLKVCLSLAGESPGSAILSTTAASSLPGQALQADESRPGGQQEQRVRQYPGEGGSQSACSTIAVLSAELPPGCYSEPLSPRQFYFAAWDGNEGLLEQLERQGGELK